MTDPKKDHAADNARREREEDLDDKNSGTQEKKPNKDAEDDIRNESADRAANAAIGHKPSG